MRGWIGIVLLGFLVASESQINCRNEYTDIYVYHNTDCGLTEIPANIPAGAYQVWVDINQISDISAGAFSQLADCTFLVLDRNKLTRIRPDMWKGLDSLKELHLYHNLISHIEPSSFARLKELRGLYMERNKLTTMEQNVFDDLVPNNLVLGINHDPLQCDSRMCWIKQGEEDGRITLHHEARGITWSKPSCVNYPGFRWDDVTITCPSIGSHDIRDVSTIIIDNHSIPTTNPGNQNALMNNLTVGSNTKDESQEKAIYYVLGGVAGGVIFISIVVLIVVIILKRSRNSTPISEERRTEEVLPYKKLLHIKDAPPLPYPSQYITQLTGKDIDDSEYEVPVSHQDQHDGHSLYEDVDDPEEVYEDVQDTET